MKTASIIRNISALLYLIVNCQFTQAQDSLIPIHHVTYDILYNQTYHCPSVVEWSLEAWHLGRASAQPHRSFMQDIQAPRPRVSTQDYTNSGYHRGHLCPAGDRGARYDWWYDTFYMTNVAPMTPALNTGAWKNTEDECRVMVKRGCELSILVVPLFIDSIAPPFSDKKIHVPSHYYKSVSCTRHDGHYVRWLLRNTDDTQDYRQCTITTDSAERLLKGVATSCTYPYFKP